MIAPGSGGEMRTNSPYLRPITRVPTPSRTLYYEENIGRWAWSCRREIDDCTWIGAGVDPGPTQEGMGEGNTQVRLVRRVEGGEGVVRLGRGVGDVDTD